MSFVEMLFHSLVQSVVIVGALYIVCSVANAFDKIKELESEIEKLKEQK